MAIATHGKTGRTYFYAPRGTGRSMNSPPERGWIEFEFAAPAAGTYRIWGSAISPSTSHDSFHVTMPGASASRILYTGNNEAWGWIRIGGDVRLAAGRHRIRFHPREDDTWMSRLLVTDDLQWAPGRK